MESSSDAAIRKLETIVIMEVEESAFMEHGKIVSQRLKNFALQMVGNMGCR